MEKQRRRARHFSGPAAQIIDTGLKAAATVEAQLFDMIQVGRQRLDSPHQATHDKIASLCHHITPQQAQETTLHFQGQHFRFVQPQAAQRSGDVVHRPEAMEQRFAALYVATVVDQCRLGGVQRTLQ